MKIISTLSTAAFALSMIVAGNAFAGAAGKVDAVENDGRAVTIAGNKISLGNSSTKVTIGGKPGDRGQIKVGMTYDAKGKGTAKTVDCK